MDLDYMRWVLWLITPVIIVLLLPLIIMILLYGSALFLTIHKHRHRLYEVLESRDVWEGARCALASFWDAWGWLWHGYELEGLEKIPDRGSAMLVYYHGAIPVDFYYMAAKIILHKRRNMKVIGDRFLFKVPGWKLLMEVFNVIPGSQDSCVELLNQGELMGVSPGGVREAMFSDENYTILWGRRSGFAKVALRANAPVYPVFTMNVRETFRYLHIGFFKSLLKKFYDMYKLPLLPPYGNFPVYIKTFIGDPVPYNSDTSAEVLASEVSVIDVSIS
ncbi:PREDICTED: transmembrane protein 68-like [Priapulus caudatus]|uniref:Transmembrane protein 68-like n=1 Tax=Priapulus caudatus TaxID=37621 RepID=A0ABM1ETZ8_PRICU|nr:PREDICTED: transmembrane protein 68-like [Priapulus caudatus]